MTINNIPTCMYETFNIYLFIIILFEFYALAHIINILVVFIKYIKTLSNRSTTFMD